MAAASYGNVPAAITLLDQPAAMDATNKWGITALMLAYEGTHWGWGGDGSDTPRTQSILQGKRTICAELLRRGCIPIIHLPRAYMEANYAWHVGDMMSMDPRLLRLREPPQRWKMGEIWLRGPENPPFSSTIATEINACGVRYAAEHGDTHDLVRQLWAFLQNADPTRKYQYVLSETPRRRFAIVGPAQFIVSRYSRIDFAATKKRLNVPIKAWAVKRVQEACYARLDAWPEVLTALPHAAFVRLRCALSLYTVLVRPLSQPNAVVEEWDRGQREKGLDFVLAFVDAHRAATSVEVASAPKTSTARRQRWRTRERQLLEKATGLVMGYTGTTDADWGWKKRMMLRLVFCDPNDEMLLRTLLTLRRTTRGEERHTASSEEYLASLIQSKMGFA